MEPNVECLMVMAYTGWTKQTALAAIAQWKSARPDWTANYLKSYPCSSAPNLTVDECVNEWLVANAGPSAVV